MENDNKVTAADIKKQIEEATKGNLAMTPGIVGQINASESTTKEPEIKPEPETAAKGMETPDPTQVDFKEWGKKKGIDWTTDDAVLAALHKSDQQFHEKRKKEKENDNQAYTPPVYQNPYPYRAPQPYTPPDRAMIENIARQYNMLPEDAEKIIALNRDFYEAISKSEREKVERKFEEMRIANEKNTVFRELSTDPIFRRPEVGMEYHKVIEEMQISNPQSFEENPNVYRLAYDRALANITRRNLEGQPLTEGITPQAKIVTPPTRPPKQFNRSGGSSLENESGFDADIFYGLKSSEEKKAYLEKVGAVSKY